MKKKEDFSLDFFLTQESFIKWARGDRSQAGYWKKWLQQHPESEDQYNKALFIASEMNIKPEVVSDEWIDQIKRGIDEQIDSGAPTHQLKTTRSKSKPIRWYYAAASIMLIAGLSFFWGYYASNKQDNDQLTYRETKKGEKLTFYLNDGTRVTLNSMSKIHYKNISDSSRTVFLSGEAFFEVVKDSSRPFTVVTDYLSTTALGTSFNVHALNDNHTVGLVTGRVLLEDNKKNKLQLFPGQVANGGKENSLAYSKEDISSQVAWKDGIILFYQADREEVFNKLSVWYGVDFKIQGGSNDRQWQYTGSFDNKNLHVVLMSLSYVKNFTYTIEDDTVYVQI